MGNVAIRARGLSKRYTIQAAHERHDTLRDQIAHRFRRALHRAPARETVWAVRDVSFDIKHGEIVGFVGHNGAGKSTILKMLARVVEPTAGRAELYGRVGALLEVGVSFDRELTGRENTYLNGAILGMRRAEIERKFDAIVAFAELEQYIDTPVKRYSSGMYVRLGFAIAAHLQQEILIVDEVLAVGDVAFQKKCLDQMGEVVRQGRTVLFVSHNMTAIQGFCSRCYLLNRGELIAEGPPATVIERYLAEHSNHVGALWRSADGRAGTGSGEIQFTGVSVLDRAGRPIELAYSGQDIDLAVRYMTPDGRSASRVDVHIAFYTALGQFMFNCSSEACGYPFDVLPPTGEVICRIPGLPLAPGHYVFNLFSTVRGGIADWVERAGSLKVVAGDFFGTGQLKTHDHGLLVRHSWILSSHEQVCAE
jgi:homopolymeric O-antigen transport system ATP-binding protein